MATSSVDKLFVAGVSWNTTDEAFKQCFTQFGEVAESQVMREPSGRSRGFGFVVFKDPAIKDTVLGQQLQLDGRQLDIKLAVPKEELKTGSEASVDSKKLWIAGLSWDTTDDSLFNYFARIGEIEKASIMRDKVTGKSRGFGFVTYKTQETTDTALKRTDLELDGRKLELKLAVPKGGAISAQPKKIYVAGMLETTTEATFQEYFAQFGTITECSVQKDKAGKSRGFGFVTYDTAAGASAAISHAAHSIDSKKVDVKAAVPRNPVSNFPPAKTGPGYGMGYGMAAANAMRMAAARQYQQYQQAQQAAAAYAAATRAAQPQAAQGYPGQYGAAPAAQAFAMNPSMPGGASMNPSMNPSMPSMNPTMNPQTNQMNAAMPTASQSAYDRYPANAYSAASAAAYPGAGAPQSYEAYAQEQNRQAQEQRGAYAAANVYAQGGSRAAPAATDPYAQAYAGNYAAEGEAYQQYGAHARRSTNRTVGYHPYSRA